YRGCEFGCKYCYARYTHEFIEMRDGRDFERKIFAKVNAPELLREEIRQAKDKGLPVALGTATDPYQPAEKQFELTRRMLEALAGFEGLDFSITTKSVLILRDLDLLRLIAERHRFGVHMTVTTLDARLARRASSVVTVMWTPKRCLSAINRRRSRSRRIKTDFVVIEKSRPSNPASASSIRRVSSNCFSAG